MTLTAILQPARLGLRLRLAGIARRDAGRTEERIALLGLASLVVLVASASVHARLLVAGERRDLVLGRIFLGLLTTALTLTLVPFPSAGVPTRSRPSGRSRQRSAGSNSPGSCTNVRPS